MRMLPADRHRSFEPLHLPLQGCDLELFAGEGEIPQNARHVLVPAGLVIPLWWRRRQQPALPRPRDRLRWRPSHSTIMYNLLVSYDTNSWNGDPWTIERDRCIRVGECTDEDIVKRFGALGALEIRGLLRFPSIFAYEMGRGKDPRFGFIRDVIVQRQQARVKLTYDLVECPRFVSADELESLAPRLGISSRRELGSEHPVVNRAGQPRLVVTGRQRPPATLELGHRVSHDDGMPGQLQHVDVVEVVADGHDGGLRDLAPGRPVPEGRALRAAFRDDVQEREVALLVLGQGDGEGAGARQPAHPAREDAHVGDPSGERDLDRVVVDMGVVLPEEGFLEGLRTLCDEHGGSPGPRRAGTAPDGAGGAGGAGIPGRHPVGRWRRSIRSTDPRSSIRAPRARRMNGGAPPTAEKARTGLSTPPGRIPLARAKRRAERLRPAVLIGGERYHGGRAPRPARGDRRAAFRPAVHPARPRGFRGAAPRPAVAVRPTGSSSRPGRARAALDPPPPSAFPG